MVEIRKVSTKRELKQFVQFYYDLYRGSEQAVPYLFFDEMATLRRDKKRVGCSNEYPVPFLSVRLTR